MLSWNNTEFKSIIILANLIYLTLLILEICLIKTYSGLLLNNNNINASLIWSTLSCTQIN